MRTSVFFDRKLSQFVNIDDLTKIKIQKEYAHLNLDREFAAMRRWLLSDRGKRRRGNMRFILGWLDRASRGVEGKENVGVLEVYITNYLEELWTKARPLLQANSKNS